MRRDREASAGHPDDLPESAVEYWPDLAKWPTPEDVDRFVRCTRKHADVRLAVLTGLRWWEAVDLTPAWNWVASLLALVGITIAASASQIVWIGILTGLLVAVCGVVLLTRLINLNSKADLRRRQARVWLQAFEDGLRH